MQYVLRDGPSYTGTFVDNVILGDRERRVIEGGTLFTIGAQVLFFILQMKIKWWKYFTTIRVIYS